DDLAVLFAEHDFDLRWLIAGICKSQAYQFACGGRGRATVGVRPIKVLSPEQVFDSLETALALPISSIDNGPRYNGERRSMVARLNEAAGARPDEYRGGIPQTLLMMNGGITADATNLDKSRTLRAVVEAPFLDAREKLDTLFLATLTRRPTAAETEALMTHAGAAVDDDGEAYAEILWSLVNGPEFVLLR
ncbi:MAG: hypothetical protein AAF961_16380, partial [Planctomycetota bacterium]